MPFVASVDHPSAGQSAAATLSPSEIMLLRATEFVPGYKGAAYVAKQDALMRAVWLAATAAVVVAGDVQLTVSTRRRLFGLFTTRSAHVAPGRGRGEWPEGSLEAALVAQVNRGPAALRDVYYALIGLTCEGPEWHALWVARAGLIGRGLAAQQEVTQGKGFLKHKTTDLVVPPATAALVTQVDVLHVRSLAEPAGVSAETWTRAGRALKHAVARRTVVPQRYDRT